MASQLKHFFDRNLISSLASDFARVHGTFNASRFEKECLAGLDGLELMARGHHIAEVLRRHLPEDFGVASRILIQTLEARGQQADPATGMASFRYLPHAAYVAKYGLDHFEDSMRVQYELTKAFTAEFSIREFLVRYPDETYRQLREWASDPNVHVRRLVSEGTRPRLPWAPRLRAFQRDPAPVIALLELLKDDEEPYVRRSVANSLNDVGKDHPSTLVAVCGRWLEGAPAGRQWIVKHALRSLIKKGHTGALALIGASAVPLVKVSPARFSPRSPRRGGRVEFSFDIDSTAKRKSQDLLIDYRVHFVKSNGTTSPKVFKLKRVNLRPGETVSTGGSVSLQALTTRKHYPGEHRVEAVINGQSFALGSFLLK